MPSNQESTMETKLKLFGEISGRWFLANPGNPIFDAIQYRTAFNVVQAAGTKAPEELLLPGKGIYFQVEATSVRVHSTAFLWDGTKAILGLVETGGTITSAGIAAMEFVTGTAADACAEGTYKSANSTATPKAKLKSGQRYQSGIIVQATHSGSVAGTIAEYKIKARPVASFA